MEVGEGNFELYERGENELRSMYLLLFFVVDDGCNVIIFRKRLCRDFLL